MKRLIYLLGFLVSALLLGTVYYFQYAKGIQPCPLCIMQRVAFYALVFLCLALFLFKLKKIRQKILELSLVLFSLFGIGIASRQIYLQHLPPGQAPPCAPSLDFMLENFPLHQTLEALFYGSGDCAQIHWRFWGLAMSEWSLIFLIGFLVVSLWLLFKKR
jgi:disulfide bond formation protein DsbB